MKKLFYSLLVSILIPSLAQAANLFVDKDNSCPGAGSTGDPYCSIQNAMDVAVAGDHIKIRDAATNYTETATTTSSHDGTAQSPIVIEPDTAHNPNLVGGIILFNVSYWTVQNLKCDASAISSTSQACVNISSENRTTTGNVVTGMTITNWGGTNQAGGGNAGRSMSNDGYPISVRGSYVAPLTWPMATISNNTITTPIEVGINLTHSDGSIISNNTISGVRCGVTSGYRQENGIFIGGENKNLVISGNNIHDVQTESACYAVVTTRPEGFDLTSGGVYCDVGSESVTVEKNYIYNFTLNNSSSGSSRASGIFWENRCNHATVQRNVIYNIKSDTGSGIQDSGYSNCAAANANKYYHNTIYDVSGDGAINLRSKSWNTEVKNNIIIPAFPGDGYAIIVGPEAVACGGHVINGNQYFRPSGSAVFQYNATQTTSFATWQSACNCDSSGGTGDPLFIAAGSNFALTSTSPAIDAGITLGGALYNGSAPDRGAFERFTALNAEVGAVATNKLVLNLAMNLNQPMLITNTTGWAWTGGTISSVAVTGNAQLTFTLSGAFGGGASTITYTETTGNATDSALIGGTLKQRLSGFAAFTVTDNTGGAPAGSVGLSHWRVYLLQGASDAAWAPKCVQDSTNCVVAPGSRVWVRYKLRNSSGSDYASFNLTDWWRYNGGSYAALTGSYVNGVKVLGTGVQLGSVIADGTTLTVDLLTGNESTNVACVANRSANSIPALTMVNASEAECARALDVSTSATPGATFEMCPYRDDGTALTCATPVKLTVGSYGSVE